MNTILQILTNLYSIVRNWFSPPKKVCTHCEPEQHHPSNYHPPQKHTHITGTILYQGEEIGKAYNVDDRGKVIYASSLVFVQEKLGHIFLNGVPDPNSARDGFEVVWEEPKYDLIFTYRACNAYLLTSDPAIYVCYRGQDQVWLNHSVLEFSDVLITPRGGGLDSGGVGG